VTVFFRESIEETQAKSVVASLSKLVEDGEMHLKSHRGVPLNVPKQNLTLVAPDMDSQVRK